MKGELLRVLWRGGGLEPASEDVEHQQMQGLDGVDGGDGKQVQSEMVGTSAEGSKRKFEAVEEDDGVLEKRIRGSSDETPNHLEKNDLMKVITVRDLGS